MRYLLAAIISLIAIAPVSAAPHECKPALEVVNSLMETGGFRSFGRLSGIPMAKANVIYNSIESVSDDRYDLIILMNAKSGRGLMLVGNGGQVCHGVAFEPDKWAKLIDILFGVGA
jgi:hypothetical protein